MKTIADHFTEQKTEAELVELLIWASNSPDLCGVAEEIRKAYRQKIKLVSGQAGKGE